MSSRHQTFRSFSMTSVASRIARTTIMNDNILHRWFPAAQRPLIISAPMFTVANGKLAAAVTQAGGLGMVPGGMDPSPESAHLAAMDEQLKIASQELNHETKGETSSLPIGVGFLTLLASADAYRANVLPIIERHRPACVWLFGSDPADDLYQELTKLFKDAGRIWSMKVFVQVGSVAGAKQAVDAGADVVVAQGSDAGGHGWAQSASVMTLVPEIVDMLESIGKRSDVGVVAAGGIVDGRGVAAALALGADAVTMGTRFMTACEADSPEAVRSSILSTTDGGVTTTKWNDAIMGYPTWSELYGGRTVRHAGLVDLANGTPVETVHELFKTALSTGDASRMVTFAGTGVGLVKTTESAGDIVTSTLSEARNILGHMQSVAS